MINIEHDTQADVLYLQFYEADYKSTREVSPGVYGSFDADQHMYAVEIHAISRFTDTPEQINFQSVGQIAAPTITVDQFAELHGMNPNSVRKILQDDEKLSDEDRRIPGAFKEGNKNRGVWRIPLKTARNWVKSNRGRPQTSADRVVT